MNLAFRETLALMTFRDLFKNITQNRKKKTKRYRNFQQDWHILFFAGWVRHSAQGGIKLCKLVFM